MKEFLHCSSLHIETVLYHQFEMTRKLNFVPFIINGSFVVQSSERNSTNMRHFDVPLKFDDSPLCKYIQNNFPEKFDFSKLLKAIEDDHKENPKLYLVNRETIIIPAFFFFFPLERVQFVKNLLSNTFTKEQILTCASGASNLAISELSSWQKYIISNTLIHFHTLLSSKQFYPSDELRSQFVRKVYSFFVPDSFKQITDTRLAAPIELVKGKIPVNSSKGLSIIIISSDDITILTSDLLSWPQFTYDLNCSFDSNKITLKSNETEQLCEFLIDSNNVDEAQWCNSLWPKSNPKFSSNLSVLTSSKAFKDIQLNGGEATSLAKVMTSFDTSFIFAIYNVLSNDQSSFDHIYNALFNIFASEQKELQLLKVIAYCELVRTIDLNEMFRRNNNFFRSITIFMNKVSGNYKQTTIKEIYNLLSSSEKWNPKDPSEKDEEIVDDLVKKFFGILIKEIDHIPPSIRIFCRFLRLLSERRFRDQMLTHRAIFAVFILRFVIPSLCDPQSLGVSLDPKKLTSVIQFTKLVAYVAQILIRKTDSKLTQMTNNIVERNSSLVVEFYDALCKNVAPKEISVLRPELISSVTTIRDYVLLHENEIINYSPNFKCEELFVDDLLTEFIAQSK